MKIKGIRKLSTPRLRIGQPLSLSATSIPVSVSVIQSPSAITVSTGSTALFSSSGIASNNSTVFYSWQRSTDNNNFTFISNARNSYYITNTLTLVDDSTYFRCALSANNSELVYTNSAKLSVIAAPVINYIGWYVIQ